uniref:Uncharacterized protein n=1 Tax=Prolemur simus TaxID=1328070 RepID=A0A8C8ZJ25_PROSS
DDMHSLGLVRDFRITASCRHFENKVPKKRQPFKEDNGVLVHLRGRGADVSLRDIFRICNLYGNLDNIVCLWDVFRTCLCV